MAEPRAERTRKPSRYDIALDAAIARRNELRAALVELYPQFPRISVELGTRGAVDGEGTPVQVFHYAVRLYAPGAARPTYDLLVPVEATDEAIEAEIEEAFAKSAGGGP